MSVHILLVPQRDAVHWFLGPDELMRATSSIVTDDESLIIMVYERS